MDEHTKVSNEAQVTAAPSYTPYVVIKFTPDYTEALRSVMEQKVRGWHIVMDLKRVGDELQCIPFRNNYGHGQESLRAYLEGVEDTVLALVKHPREKAEREAAEALAEKVSKCVKVNFPSKKYFRGMAMNTLFKYFYDWDFAWGAKPISGYKGDAGHMDVVGKDKKGDYWFATVHYDDNGIICKIV